MSKRNVPSGRVGTMSTKPRCGAVPHWIKGDTSALAPRLVCVRTEGHKDKRHQDGRGHQWDVTGSNEPRRIGR